MKQSNVRSVFLFADTSETYAEDAPLRQVSESQMSASLKEPTSIFLRPSVFHL